MGKSYRKPYGSWVRLRSMKAWRTQENRRLRHNAKILINNCKDYDNLVIPILNEYGGLWSSPRDGRQYLWEVPALNDCEIRRHERLHTHPSIADWHFKDGHYDNCDCYVNKRNAYYWRLSRK